jgi:hypothetical protein
MRGLGRHRPGADLRLVIGLQCLDRALMSAVATIDEREKDPGIRDEHASL